tara:strand:+ start:5715 stop:7910 length:2196 start_codon:yes stop_codon:yes gene_type:complete
MINPAKYDSVLQQMTDQQLQVLMRRPDKIPTQFVVKELNRRQKMRQQAKAQEASLQRAAGQPMQMGVEQPMQMMGEQQQQPRMMRSGGITKLQSGTVTNYVTEINEAFGRKDKQGLINIMNDDNVPVGVKQLAQNMLEKLRPDQKFVMPFVPYASEEFQDAAASGENIVSPQELAKEKIAEEQGKRIAGQADALNLQTAGGALDMSDSGFNVSAGTPFGEGVRKILRSGQQFLGIDDGDVNIDSPIGIDKAAAATAEFLSDKAKAAYSGIKSNLIDLSPEALGEKEIERRKKLQAARNELEKANTLLPSLQFESGVQDKVLSEYIDLTENFLTEKTYPGPAQKNLTKESVELPIQKPLQNNIIQNKAAEQFTNGIVANANTDLTATGEVDNAPKGIKQDIIPKYIKEMFDTDFTQKAAMDGYKKSNYLVKAGEAFESLKEDNKKIIDLHNEQTKDLVKQREEMLKMMDSMKRSPENIAFQSLIDMGLSLMASPEANFAQALGKAGQVGMQTFRNLSQEERDRVFERYKMAWDLSKAERDHQMQGLNLAKEFKLNMITGHTKLHQMEKQDENDYFNRAHTAFNTKLNQAKVAVSALNAQSQADYRTESLKIERDKLADTRRKTKLDSVPDSVKEAQWYMSLDDTSKKAANQAFNAMGSQTKKDNTTLNKIIGEVFKLYAPGTELFDNLRTELTKQLGREPTSAEMTTAIMGRTGAITTPAMVEAMANEEKGS